MTQTDKLLIEQNNLLKEVLSAVKGLTLHASVGELTTCTPAEAMLIIGVNNPRYLTYFYRQNLLNRRRGGGRFLYFKAECRTIADRIALKQIVLPGQAELYPNTKKVK